MAASTGKANRGIRCAMVGAEPTSKASPATTPSTTGRSEGFRRGAPALTSLRCDGSAPVRRVREAGDKTPRGRHSLVVELRRSCVQLAAPDAASRSLGECLVPIPDFP